MALYKIFIKKSAEKELRELPNQYRSLVIQQIKKLGENPRAFGSQRLSGRNVYRIRVGQYRIIYSIFDAVLIVEVIAIGHRKDVYR
ncbi:MAG: type II toxin-antitoxin system RelE/ParE family toxin [Deltaproteobacteria bacterium]|nr:type II toxin-antitoxin system RelE/ParE family toxin [Deltaproteobacteria bacterium]